jgi:hypothetical protein
MERVTMLQVSCVVQIGTDSLETRGVVVKESEL